jgi:hypothetical protein
VHGREIDSRRVAAFDLLIGKVGLRHGGVFPATREFLPVFARAYAEAAGRLDSIGVDPAF